MTKSEYHKNYYQKNKALLKARALKRYQKNAEQIKEQRRKYYKENTEIVLSINTKWRVNNPDKYKRIHSDIMNRRRARLKNAEYEKYNRHDIFNKFGGICIVCDKHISEQKKHPHPKSFTIHHLLPISVGGTDTIDNVAPAHLICNIKVGNKVPIAVRPRVLLNV